jgi:hypothetical protein
MTSEKAPGLGNVQAKITEAIQGKDAEALFSVMKIATRELTGIDAYEGEAEEFLRGEIERFLGDESIASLIFPFGDDENSMTIYREKEGISFKLNKHVGEKIKAKWQRLK